jgi:hypothetical protein
MDNIKFYLNNAVWEVLLYLIIVLMISIYGVDYLYLGTDLFKYLNNDTNLNQVFSFIVFANCLLQLFHLSLPFFVLLFITIRIQTHGDLLLTSICNGFIALIYIYINTYASVHSYWYNPDIYDVLLEPLNKTCENVSSIKIVSRLFEGVFELTFFIIFRVFPFVFVYLLFKKMTKQRYFYFSSAIFSFVLITHLLIEKTFDLSVDIINGRNLDSSLIVLLILIIGGMVWGVSNLIPLIIFTPFIEDYTENKTIMNVLFVSYLVFIFSANIVISRFTDIKFPNIPKAFPGEVLKSEDELYWQEWEADQQELYEDYR